MRVVVTGHAGYIGSEMVPMLREQGRVSGSPSGVERRFSDAIRLEPGCESSERRGNRREQTLSYHPEE